MKDFWQNLGRNKRIGLISGVAVILLLTVLAGWWLLRADYQVLFSDLKPQDASAMIAELERLKIPYKIGDSGTAILVDKAAVHTTRIKLMGKNIPLHGTVGLELFNNTDFGMTEFAQKINYQRALQGELTRTILALSEISEVRVHLALPEQGLFKQAANRPKAAITITLKQGNVLRPEQVNGIQRLIAASVPNMTMQDVTIVDHYGVALNRPAGNEGENEAGSSRLDLKKETEAYLTRKVALVLERAFGPGQSLASVDVTLNMDQIRVTTEDVIGTPGKGNQSSTGVVVRERESIRDASLGAPLDVKAQEGGLRNGGSSQREVDYQVGRRIEQVVSQPGAIRRIQAVALVSRALTSEQEEQVRKTVAAAVGASLERGDTVVVQPIGNAVAGNLAVNQALQAVTGKNLDVVNQAQSVPQASDRTGVLVIVLIVLCLIGLLIFIFFAFVYKRAHCPNYCLTETERQAALRQIHAWMQQHETEVKQSPFAEQR